MRSILKNNKHFCCGQFVPHPHLLRVKTFPAFRSNRIKTFQDDEEDFGTGKFAKYQKIMWDLIEKPDTSTAASVISIMSTVFVAVSIVGMTISTLPSLQYEVGQQSVIFSLLNYSQGCKRKSSGKSWPCNGGNNLYSLVHIGIFYQVRIR